MSVDFCQTNFRLLSFIMLPKEPKPAEVRLPKPKVQIQRSFKQAQESTVHKALLPQIQMLKEMHLRSLSKEAKVEPSQPKQTQQTKAKTEEIQQTQQKLKVDESGHLRDEHGNLIFVRSSKTSLQINRKKQHEAHLAELVKKQKVKQFKKLQKTFIDSNLVVGSFRSRVRRSRLGLQFLEQGTYQAVQSSSSDLVHRIVRKRTHSALGFNREVPDIQWWDAVLAQSEIFSSLLNCESESVEPTAEELLRCLKDEAIGSQVVLHKVDKGESREHKVTIPTYLTKEERKKLKRKRKRDQLLEKNDKIRLGLIEPDKPKLKISNMAVVMRQDFIMDPTRVQAQARRQIEQRLNKHLEQNSVRKLSRVKRKQKVIRKYKRDSAKECRRIVFRIQKMEDPGHIFKVNTNASQLALNGFVLKPNSYHQQASLVVAEGGAKAIRFYRNLMLNRIRWGETTPGNKCLLEWEGEIEGSTLGKWQTFEVGDNSESIRFLTEKGVQNLQEFI